MRSVKTYVLLASLVTTSSTAAAQKPPAMRQIGPLQRVTPDSIAFASITNALAMPGGRVMINDARGRRVVLLDSTLKSAAVVADTSAATANAYGMSWATLIRYRGDSALLLVPSTLSMFVIGPTGATARVMAIPRPNEAQMLAAVLLGSTPAVDGRARLVHFGSIGVGNGSLSLPRGTAWLQGGKPSDLARQIMGRGSAWVSPTMQRADSGAIARVDLETRVIDTAALMRIPKFKREMKLDGDGIATGIEATPDPLPVIDQWTVLRDGTLAIVRGGDYHVDWIDSAGRKSSTPKMPFDWERVSDAKKTALIDSAVANWQPASRDTAPTRSGRGGVGSVRAVAVRAPLSDVPDYFPPFDQRSVTSDWDGNLWIRTSKIVDGRPVYDVINRKGEVFERVQLPRYRVIAGFGPGVVYMAVIDNTRNVRLERARIK